MKKIFCLMGKSSSGKDTIFKELLMNTDLGLKPITIYTTRPRRSNEVNGKEYFFVDTKDLDGYVKAGKVIEKREYDTVFGKWYYCTVDDGQIDLANNNYLIITTLAAFRNIQDYFGAEQVVPLLIEVEDGERLERALKREQSQRNPNYEEMCRRFLADSNDFSLEKIQSAGIKKLYVNNCLEECINNLKNDLKNLVSSSGN